MVLLKPSYPPLLCSAGFEYLLPTYRRPHTAHTPPHLFPYLNNMTSFGGEDDPNIRELVERMQKYHDEVEQEFTGQKVRRARGRRGHLSSVRFSSHPGLKKGTASVFDA